VPESSVLKRTSSSVGNFDEYIAIEGLVQHSGDLRRAGNFVNSAFGVIEHVADEQGLSDAAATRIFHVLRDQRRFHEQHLANISALTRAFAAAVQHEQKYTGDQLSEDGLSYSRIREQARVDPTAIVDNSHQYWRRIRNELLSWLGLSIDDLGRALGLSYATVANLGKRRPQGRTIAPIMHVHGLLKALLDRQGDDARAWLAGEGSRLLVQDVTLLEDAINKRLFSGVTGVRTGISVEEDAPVVWRALAPSNTQSEAF
jgi:hypothetical protein